MCVRRKMRILTFALESLSKQSIQQRATVITKCGRHEVVRLKAVRNIYLESFSKILKNKVNTIIELAMVRRLRKMKISMINQYIGH
jgi:hypothetical protein